MATVVTELDRVSPSPPAGAGSGMKKVILPASPTIRFKLVGFAVIVGKALISNVKGGLN